MSGGRSGIVVKFMAVGLVVSLGLDSRGNAAVKTWDGGGGNSNWNTAANWDGAGSGAVPAAGDSLVFAGATKVTNSNNFTAGTSFDGISFASGASAFTLGGSSVALTSGVTNSSSNLQTIALPIFIAATQTFDTGSAGLTQGATGAGSLGVISGAGGLIKTGSGTLTLNAANTYGGATTISEGRLFLSNSGGGTLPSSTAVSVASLATFDIGDRSHTVGSISGAGSIVGNASNNQFTVGGNNGSTLFSGNIGFVTAGNLIKNGTGILTLSGTNTKMTSQVNSGTLVFQNQAAKPTGTATVAAGGTIGLGVGAVSGDYSSANVTALFNTNTLTGFSLNAATGVAIDTTAGNFTQGTALTAARALTKLGANALTLSGANTYSGATTVSAGTLVVGDGMSGSLGSSSVVTVRGGAKLAGDGGTIGGAAAIGSGGILAPGSATSGSIGLVTMSSMLSFVAGSVFDWDINTGAETYDRVGLGSSNLSVIDGAIFNVASSTPFSDLYWSVPRTWTDIFGTNDVSGFDVAHFTYSAGGIAVGAPSSGSFSVSGNSLMWNVSSVPEPVGTVGTLCFFGGSLMLRRSRKRA